MKTTVSVQDVLKCNGCESGLDDGIALAAMLGVPADGDAPYDEILELAKQQNKPRVSSTVRNVTQIINRGSLLRYSHGFHRTGSQFDRM